MVLRSDFNFDLACVYSRCRGARWKKLLIISATFTRRRNIGNARVRIGNTGEFQKLINGTTTFLIATFEFNGNTCSSGKYFWT